MVIIDYLNIGLDIIAILAFLWSIIQSFQIRNRVKYDEMITETDWEELEELFKKLEADIKKAKAENVALKSDVWDYVDQVLRPLNQRLATRASRQKAVEIEQNTKKGGIIPYPTNGTTQ